MRRSRRRRLAKAKRATRRIELARDEALCALRGEPVQVVNLTSFVWFRNPRLIAK